MNRFWQIKGKTGQAKLCIANFVQENKDGKDFKLSKIIKPTTAQYWTLHYKLLKVKALNDWDLSYTSKRFLIFTLFIASMALIRRKLIWFLQNAFIIIEINPSLEETIHKIKLFTSVPVIRLTRIMSKLEVIDVILLGFKRFWKNSVKRLTGKTNTDTM